MAGQLGFIVLEVLVLIRYIFFINFFTKFAFRLRGGNEIPA
jgi:hypothetical protein